MFLAAAVLLPHLLTGAPPPNSVKLPKPGVVYRPAIASATTKPWVDANGWLLQREGVHKLYCEAPGNSAALAAAESFIYKREVAIRTDAAGTAAFKMMLTFLKSLDSGPETIVANIGVVDDGTPQTGEVMNLLARHNLLYRLETEPDPKLKVNLVSPVANNPELFAQRVRQQVTDAARVLRIYGSDVVLARLTGDEEHLRLHLLNYGDRPIHGLRVRLLGAYQKNKVSAFNLPGAALAEYEVQPDATEFSLPEMRSYVVVDLFR